MLHLTSEKNSVLKKQVEEEESTEKNKVTFEVQLKNYIDLF